MNERIPFMISFYDKREYNAKNDSKITLNTA